jgi:hypothetical protein
MPLRLASSRPLLHAENNHEPASDNLRFSNLDALRITSSKSMPWVLSISSPTRLRDNRLYSWVAGQTGVE